MQIINLAAGFPNKIRLPILVIIKLIKANLLTLKTKNRVIEIFHGTLVRCIKKNIIFIYFALRCACTVWCI